MKSIKVKSSAERADELLADPEAYFRGIREEVRRNVLRNAGDAVHASMLRRRGRRLWLRSRRAVSGE